MHIMGFFYSRMPDCDLQKQKKIKIKIYEHIYMLGMSKHQSNHSQYMREKLIIEANNVKEG